MKPQKTIKAKSVKETEIKEGLTGVKLVSERIKASRANKAELQSLSFNLKQLEKHGQDFLKHNGVTFKECTPVKLLEFLTQEEKAKKEENGNKFTFWAVETLVVRYGKAKREAEAKIKHEAKQVQRTNAGQLVTV